LRLINYSKKDKCGNFYFAQIGNYHFALAKFGILFTSQQNTHMLNEGHCVYRVSVMKKYVLSLIIFIISSVSFAEVPDDLLAKAQSGDPVALNAVGALYYNGDEVPQNYSEAFKWYKRAAEKGYAEAQYMLGLMYDNGEGVPQNYSETFKWYKRAAEQGHADAQYNLGLMYHNGKGVPQNYSEAFKWYKRAAEQGVAEAQNNLGVMYENGEGVTRDLQEAYTYFILAKANGNSDAENNIEAVGRRLSAKQINAAQQKI
jgi:TPR repeat protein